MNRSSRDNSTDYKDAFQPKSFYISVAVCVYEIKIVSPGTFQKEVRKQIIIKILQFSEKIKVTTR